jgi:MFS family permease
MFGWYRSASGQVRRVFWTCGLAWGLDAADGLVYQYLIPVLMTALGLTLTQAGLIASANYFASALGGWIGGWLCDRYGRARILQLTILWFSVFSFLSGFANSYEQLLAVRLLQGLGFGAEWAVGAVLLGEMLAPEHRGKALGLVQSAAAIGSGLAALAAGPIAAALPGDWGWRAVFWAGLAPALLVFFVRRRSDESELFKAAQRRKAEQPNVRPPGVFSPALIGVTLAATLLAIGAQGAGYALSNYVTTFLKTERGLTQSAAGVYVLINSAGGFFGFMVNAWIGDRFGRRTTFRLFGLGFAAAILIYLFAPLADGVALAAAGMLVGFFQFGIYGSFGPFLTELFPTEVRGAGQAFAYNSGRASSFIFIQGVALLAPHLHLTGAVAVMAFAAVACAIIATFLLPETAGRDLEAIVAPGAAVPAKKRGLSWT